MKNVPRKLVTLLFCLFILAAPVVAWLNQEAIYDAYRLRNYQAPLNVSQLATDDTLTDYSRHLFYVYHPQLQNKEDFHASCSGSEKTIVLGCYILRRGIYLYDIQDDRLAGVEQVTAAHEMLHAAYDRLSLKEKKQVNVWIADAYSKNTDQRIKDTFESYKKDGADTTNELHSILGTEVRGLSPELENYYKRFFSNRSTVVTYSEKYQAAFSARKAQGDQYIGQLNSLKTQIDNLNNQLSADRGSIDQDFNKLQQDRGSISDVNEFNKRIRAFNNRVSNYNSRVNQVSSLIDKYNDILGSYNALVVEEQQLYKAIDSRPAAVQSQ